MNKQPYPMHPAAQSARKSDAAVTREVFGGPILQRNEVHENLIDVIGPQPQGWPAKRATPTIPIVFVGTDPIELGTGRQYDGA